MTTNEIKEKLNHLIGQKYESYDYTKVGLAIRDLMPKDLVDQITYTIYHNTLQFVYKYGYGKYDYHSIVTVVIKKRKGETHRSFYGNSTDYYFKDFDVEFTLGYSTLEGALNHVRECLKSKEERKDKQFNQLKALLETTGMTFDEFRTLAGYAERDWYEIDKKLKGTAS